MLSRRHCWGLLSFVAVTAIWGLTSPTTSHSDEPPQAFNRPQPVEDDMHEFMEYACEEPYKRLKAALAAAPANNSAWKGIKSDALLLAESGNLLLMRGPEERRNEWATLSQSMRSAGADLYREGKAKNFEGARTKWEALIVQCNACHKSFADGEHQLVP